jgi:hypothetical protein
VITRIIYIIINFRLSKKQEACTAFIVLILFILLLGKSEYFVGAIFWFLFDISGVTNKLRKGKKELR